MCVNQPLMRLMRWNFLTPWCVTSVRRCSDVSIMNVFDREAKKSQRNRIIKFKDYNQFLAVKDEIGFRVFDRICDIKRSFKIAVDLGCGLGHVSKHITKAQQLVDHIHMIEMANSMLENAACSPDVPCEKWNVNEEMGLQFAESSVDLVYSSLNLHWINDLPGVFRQVEQILKPDGVFLGSLFGSDTLYELRVSLQLAEQEILGGFYPHVSPFTSVRDLGDLLSRAGFAMITLDSDELVVRYPGLWELMRDLRGMGESNCSWKRPLTMRKDVISRAAQIYRERYGSEGDSAIPASYCVLSFIGWKPDPSQPQPAARGSANVSLKDISSIMSNSAKADK